MLPAINTTLIYLLLFIITFIILDYVYNHANVRNKLHEKFGEYVNIYTSNNLPPASSNPVDFNYITNYDPTVDLATVATNTTKFNNLGIPIILQNLQTSSDNMIIAKLAYDKILLDNLDYKTDKMNNELTYKLYKRNSKY
jgi:hypothetical protein